MTRVLHVINGLQTGGAERNLVRLCLGLSRQRFEQHVISLMAPGPLSRELEEAGLDVTHLGLSREAPWTAPLALSRLVAAVRRFGPDVLQTWLYVSDLLGTLVYPLSGARALFWNLRCSDIDLSQLGWTARPAVSMLARLSPLPTAVLHNSRAGRDAHEAHGYHPRLWLEFPNGFDGARYRPDAEARRMLRAQLGLGLDTPVIGAVGRRAPEKGYAVLGQALARVAARHPDVVFLLIGRGLSLDCPELSGLPRERLRVLGDQPDVWRWYSAMDLFASGSVTEGFPNVVAEALLCGLPVAATDTGETRAVVGQAGRIVPIQQPKALADAVEAILSLAPEAKAKLGAAAREQVLARYGLDKMLSRYGALYELAAQGCALDALAGAAL